MLTETPSEIQNIFESEPDFAWTLLQAQIELQMQPSVSGQQISKLLQLYMKGVEKMNSVSDSRQGYFKSKVTTLMTKQTVIKSLKQTNPMKKKSKHDCVDTKQTKPQQAIISPQQRRSIQRKKTLQRQLRERQKQIQMRMAHSLQQNNVDSLKRLIEQEESREINLVQKINNQMTGHERRLQERIESRKLRTTTNRSKKSASVLNQESETQTSTLKMESAHKKEDIFNQVIQQEKENQTKSHRSGRYRHSHRIDLDKQEIGVSVISKTRTKSLQANKVSLQQHEGNNYDINAQDLKAVKAFC